MARRIIVLGCLVAGVYLLAGGGWALLAAGVLLEVAWPRGAALAGERPAWPGAAVRRVRAAAAAARRAAQAMPQQITAAGAAAVGAVLVPVGVGLVAGVGAALVTLGALTLLLGLQLDRTA